MKRVSEIDKQTLMHDRQDLVWEDGHLWRSSSRGRVLVSELEARSIEARLSERWTMRLHPSDAPALPAGLAFGDVVMMEVVTARGYRVVVGEVLDDGTVWCNGFGHDRYAMTLDDVEGTDVFEINADTVKVIERRELLAAAVRRDARLFEQLSPEEQREVIAFWGRSSPATK